jgi:hypothetical protein
MIASIDKILSFFVKRDLLFGFYTFRECHKTEFLQNYTATAHKERERLGDRRNVGESSCTSGDGTGRMAQPLMFMMMMILS